MLFVKVAADDFTPEISIPATSAVSSTSSSSFKESSSNQFAETLFESSPSLGLEDICEEDEEDSEDEDENAESSRQRDEDEADDSGDGITMEMPSEPAPILPSKPEATFGANNNGRRSLVNAFLYRSASSKSLGRGKHSPSISTSRPRTRRPMSMGAGFAEDKAAAVDAAATQQRQDWRHRQGLGKFDKPTYSQKRSLLKRHCGGVAPTYESIQKRFAHSFFEKPLKAFGTMSVSHSVKV